MAASRKIAALFIPPVNPHSTHAGGHPFARSVPECASPLALFCQPASGRLCRPDADQLQGLLHSGVSAAAALFSPTQLTKPPPARNPTVRQKSKFGRKRGDEFLTKKSSPTNSRPPLSPIRWPTPWCGGRASLKSPNQLTSRLLPAAPQPGGRQTIAHRFNGGFRDRRGSSPARYGRIVSGKITGPA